MFQHHHFFNFLKNRELNELYASIAMRSFALALISVFIPIYLIKLEYTLNQVIFFYLIANLAHAFFAILAGRISSRYGFKHCILLSAPFLIIFYLLLYSLATYHWSLILLGLLFGTSNAFFWVGYHTDFAVSSKKKHRGREIGISNIVFCLGSAAGPVIGGLILTLAGFQLLFILVAIIIFASVIPLFLTEDTFEPMDCSVGQIFRDQNWKDTIGLMSKGAETGAGKIFWPIYIYFTIFDTFTGLGSVTSLALFSSIIFSFVIGKFADISRRTVLRIASIANAFIWGIKLVVKTGFQVFIVDSFYGMSETAAKISFNALSYDKAKKNPLETIIYREIMIQLGRIVLLVAMLFVSDIIYSFIFGSAASLMLMFF